MSSLALHKGGVHGVLETALVVSKICFIFWQEIEKRRARESDNGRETRDFEPGKSYIIILVLCLYRKWKCLCPEETEASGPFNDSRSHPALTSRLTSHSTSLFVSPAVNPPRLTSLLAVHIPSRAHPDPPMTAGPLAGDDIWKIVVIHQVPLSLSTLLLGLLLILLLILSQYQILAPMVLSSTVDVVHLAAGSAMNWLGHAVDVATLVILEVLLQVQAHISVAVSRAGYPCEGGLSALGAELSVHLSRHVEATVAAQDPCLELFDTRKVGRGDKAV